MWNQFTKSNQTIPYFLLFVCKSCFAGWPQSPKAGSPLYPYPWHGVPVDTVRCLYDEDLIRVMGTVDATRVRPIQKLAAEVGLDQGPI